MHCDLVPWVLGTVAALDVLLGWPTYPDHWFRRRDPLHFIPHPSCMPPPPHRSLLCIHALLSSSSHHIICIISPSTSYILSVIASHFRHDTADDDRPLQTIPADAALPFLPHHPRAPYVGRAVLCLPLRSSFLVTTSPCVSLGDAWPCVAHCAPGKKRRGASPGLLLLILVYDTTR